MREGDCTPARVCAASAPVAVLQAYSFSRISVIPCLPAVFAASNNFAFIAARYGAGSSSRQKSKQRTRSVLNALARAMLRSRTSPCWSYVKSALNCAPLGLNFDLGAPGQSTLKSGLAMSVTRSLYFSRMRRASATSLASSLRMFLFHMPRSSTHSNPNSREMTSQARPKSWPSSSLITEMRKGEFIPSAPVFLGDILYWPRRLLSGCERSQELHRVRRPPSRGSQFCPEIQKQRERQPIRAQAQQSDRHSLRRARHL